MITPEMIILNGIEKSKITMLPNVESIGYLINLSKQ